MVVAARGVAALISNGGTMELLVSPRLSEEDISVMKAACENPQSFIERVMLKEFNDTEALLKNDRLKALGWLLAKGYLEIKVATVYSNSGDLMTEKEVEESGLFHIKLGIVKDSHGDIITFSGSVNETAAAWVKNVEEFKVFKSWINEYQEVVQMDMEKFRLLGRGSS